MTRHRCATLSRTMGESLAGTAPPLGGSWLAVELHGPWPARPADAPLPPRARAMLSEATALGIRTQLLRRPGRRRLTPPPHTVLVASSRGERPWLELARLDDLTALGGLDLAALTVGRQTGFGVAQSEPVLLVCTHGRRDACCAEYGRPVATSLAAAYPGRVWESTHLSGDRFAANVACLPHSTYHGRVTPDVAADVAGACMRGEVVVENYRGRAGMHPAEQVAELAVRRATGERAVAAVRVDPAATTPGTGGIWRVALTVGDRRFVVAVAAAPADPPRPTSCEGCPLNAPMAYQVRGLDELTGDLARL